MKPGMIQLTRNFKHAAGMVRKDNWDWLHVTSGMERGGKSGFSLWLALILSKYGGLNFDWKNLSTVFFNEPNLAHKLMNVPNKSIVILDEAGESMFSRKSIEKAQINLIQTLMAFGAKNVFLICNIPNWRWLDKYVRQERIKSLAVIRTRGRVITDSDGERGTRGRGYFSIYPRKQVLRASRTFAGQEVKLKDPSFFGFFPDFKYYNQTVWSVYIKKKWEYLNAKKEFKPKTEPKAVDDTVRLIGE